MEQTDEIRVKQEPIDKFIDVNMPNTTVVVRPMDEVIIKQEFIEKCARRRAPIQDGYRSQFKVNMQLKREIIKVRKQVLHLWRQVQKQKRNVGRPIVNPRAETTSAIVQTKDRPTTLEMTQTESFVHLFELWEFVLTAEIQKWQTTTSHLQWGSIPLEPHQEGVRGI